MNHFEKVKRDIKEEEDGPIELMIRDLDEIAMARGKSPAPAKSPSKTPSKSPSRAKSPAKKPAASPSKPKASPKGNRELAKLGFSSPGKAISAGAGRR